MYIIIKYLGTHYKVWTCFIKQRSKFNENRKSLRIVVVRELRLHNLIFIKLLSRYGWKRICSFAFSLGQQLAILFYYLFLNKKHPNLSALAGLMRNIPEIFCDSHTPSWIAEGDDDRQRYMVHLLLHRYGTAGNICSASLLKWFRWNNSIIFIFQFFSIFYCRYLFECKYVNDYIILRL